MPAKVLESVTMNTPRPAIVTSADQIFQHADLIVKVKADAGLMIRRTAAAKSGLRNPAACAQAFRQVQERLIVMTRGAFQDGMVSMIASARQVPVLVVEPSLAENPER